MQRYRIKKQIMPSRKRNKGKDRKAKKEAERAESERLRWQGWARGTLRTETIACDHGCSLVMPNDENHPVVGFMDTLFVNSIHNKMASSINLSDSFQKYNDVWNNKSYREVARNILLSVGTNQLLDNDILGPKGISLYLSHAIVVLENYDGTSNIESTMDCRVVATKFRDLLGSNTNRRDVLKFYRKRIACSCLKQMHLEMRKSFPKTGKCYYYLCDEEKERSLLMVCSRCRVSHYCSRECQIADWPEHKCRCDMHVFAQKQQISKDAA